MISTFFFSDDETSHDSHRATSVTNRIVAAQLNSHRFSFVFKCVCHQLSLVVRFIEEMSSVLCSEDQLERQSHLMRIQVNDGRAEDDLHRCSSSLSTDMRRRRMKRRSEEGEQEEMVAREKRLE